jgi:hypothetical protein
VTGNLEPMGRTVEGNPMTSDVSFEMFSLWGDLFLDRCIFSNAQSDRVWDRVCLRRCDVLKNWRIEDFEVESVYVEV